MMIVCTLISIISIILFQKLFIRKKFIDKINDRSSHSSIATTSGGSSIFITFLIFTLYYYLNANQIFDFSLLIPLSILFTVGLYDDIYQVDFKLKFIFQIIVAKILIDYGFLIDSLNGFFGIYEISYMLSQFLTTAVFLLIVNATNFSDGIDGLAITEVLKCLLLILIISPSNFLGLNNVFIAIIFTLIPLFYFNLKKTNKVFLGDSGSLFLGGIIFVGLISLSLPEAINETNIPFPLIVFICFMYPIIDTIQVVISRIFKGLSPFKPDKNHIHHLLTKNGYSHFHSLLVISGITGVIQFSLIYYATSLG